MPTHLSCARILCFVLSILPVISWSTPCLAVEQAGISIQDSQAQISDATKSILLKGVELGRFILHYRIECDRQPKSRLLRYFSLQEAGSSCILSYEISADQQFGRNQKTPLRVDKPALHRALNTATVGGILAGGSSAFELTSNVVKEIKIRQEGYNSKAALEHFSTGLAELDRLLEKRDLLVASQTGRTKELLQLEGKLLREFRERMVLEFLMFHQDLVSAKVCENSYFFLNAAANTVGTISAQLGVRSLKTPRYAGPSNVLFLLSGAVLMTAPPISVSASAIAKKHARQTALKRLNLKAMPILDDKELADDLKRYEELGKDVGTRHPLVGNEAEQTLGLYSTAEQRFTSLLLFEEKRFRLLRQVAVQSSYLGPPIGATFLTQGILGTTAYFSYSRKPITLRKLRIADRLNYAGAVTGTVGSGTAVGATALLLGGVLAYRHHLAKENKLPEQLLNQRLADLDDVEKKIKEIGTAG